MASDPTSVRPSRRCLADLGVDLPSRGSWWTGAAGRRQSRSPQRDFYALLLDCVLGVLPEDWQPQPSSVAGTNPASGEVIWSTLFPSEIASAVPDQSTAGSGT